MCVGLGASKTNSGLIVAENFKDVVCLMVYLDTPLSSGSLFPCLVLLNLNSIVDILSKLIIFRVLHFFALEVGFVP